jgi:hypothetical protein
MKIVEDAGQSGQLLAHELRFVIQKSLQKPLNIIFDLEFMPSFALGAMSDMLQKCFWLPRPLSVPPHGVLFLQVRFKDAGLAEQSFQTRQAARRRIQRGLKRRPLISVQREYAPIRQGLIRPFKRAGQNKVADAALRLFSGSQQPLLG